MKKILLCVSLLSMFAAGFVGCSQKREWNHEQRKAMREALRSYRQMVYLDDLTDAEFVLFTDQVAGELEGTYPVYATFVEMPGVTDTVDMVVVTTIVDELNADARNMRHIFPYNYLVAQGVLPAGLDHDQQKAFYNCFAGKVNDTYATMPQFSTAILADTTDMSQLRQLRGRVGRGGEQSYCILMSGEKLSKESRARLDAMCETNDGFRLAELDLKLRGAGDINGTLQSGMAFDLKIANPTLDVQILTVSREAAAGILSGDRGLSLPEHRGLRELRRRYSGREEIDFSMIS